MQESETFCKLGFTFFYSKFLVKVFGSNLAPAMFFPSTPPPQVAAKSSQWLLELFRQAKHTHKQTDTQTANLIIKQTNKTDGQQPHTDEHNLQTRNQKCSAAMCFHTCQHSTTYKNLKKLKLPGTAN